MWTGPLAAQTALLLHSSAERYGSDLQLLALASDLDRDRYRPLVVLPERGELAPLLEQAGVETVVLPLAVLRRQLLNPGGIARIGRRLRRDRRELGRLVRERGVALVHSNTSVVLAGQPVAERAGIPHLLHVREIYEGALGGLAARAWPRLRARLARADGLACISRAVAEQFGNAQHARVIYDALVREPEPLGRDEARAALDLPADRFVVALVGRISDWKGQDVLARALAAPALAEIGAIGLVAGAPHGASEAVERGLLELRDELGVGERLRLLGYREDIGTVLGAADALAVPSTRPEPLGNVALEAAAAGLPVVASAHGGLPEVVRDGITGALVPPGQAEALARTLRTLADDPERARRLGAAGADDVRRRFARPRLAAEVQDAYDHLLSRAGR